MRRLNSIIIEAADKARVPAGGALAVDRHDFSGYITETLKNHENITVINEEINAIQMDTQLSQQDHLLQKRLRKK